MFSCHMHTHTIEQEAHSMLVHHTTTHSSGVSGIPHATTPSSASLATNTTGFELLASENVNTRNPCMYRQLHKTRITATWN